MKGFKYNVFLKVFVIVVIGMLLLIPAAMIKGLVTEREGRQQDAIWEVSGKWGGAQTLAGPIVTVPYTKYFRTYSKKDSTEKISSRREYIHFLPTELIVEGELMPEKRYRGIYEIVVYNSNVTLKGSFDDISFADFDIPKKDIHFDKAFVSIGITDLRGIEEQVALSWNGQEHSFNPGTVTNDVIGSGINSPVEILPNDSTSYDFTVTLDLKGSQYMRFVPMGEVTDVTMNSQWPNPSFDGAFLPDDREVSESGFSAHWNVLHLNRNFPQSWIGTMANTSESAFGVDLLLPVDSYQKTTRAIKYAVLFIGLTFLVFFFSEVLKHVFIHPVQYILVGIALVVFYTLLLSISEYIAFNNAFIISAIATLVLIAGYVRAILKSNTLTGLISGILFILYAFIFVIIQLQDYALLIGSIGIFIILALVMYFSRKIDWYDIRMEERP